MHSDLDSKTFDLAPVKAGRWRQYRLAMRLAWRDMSQTSWAIDLNSAAYSDAVVWAERGRYIRAEPAAEY
ncbi:hypothetical protein [Renibacterium salmoninarum]|nr:hypothetical protein [Renibacterium salmoninarum]